MTDLTTFQQVQDKIKEQVKVQFFNMLPDDAFQKLIDEEINAFFEVKGAEYTVKQSRGYNGDKLVAELSPFRALVWEQVRELTKARMKVVFESEEFTQACASPGAESMLRQAGVDRFDRLCIAMAGVFFGQMMDQAMFTVKQDVYNAVQNAGLPINTRY